VWSYVVFLAFFSFLRRHPGLTCTDIGLAGVVCGLGWSVVDSGSCNTAAARHPRAQSAFRPGSRPSAHSASGPGSRTRARDADRRLFHVREHRHRGR